MDDPQKRNLELDRLLFFSDAIVAIAITLLALGLRLDVPENHQLTFADLATPWKKYLAFILSFINIAGFWQTHHTTFSYINKIDRKMLLMNLSWLFFIVIIPFTTSIVSDHFNDTPAIFLYCSNVMMLSLIQKLIWDYGDDEITIAVSAKRIKHIDIMFTVNLANVVIAVVISLFSPLVAFILLFFKVPIFLFESMYLYLQKKGKIK